MAQLSVHKLEDDILDKYNNGFYTSSFYVGKEWHVMFLDYCIDNQIDRKDCRKAIGNGCNILEQVSFMKSYNHKNGVYADDIDQGKFYVRLTSPLYAENEHMRTQLRDESKSIVVEYTDFKQYVRWRRISDLL